MLYRPRIVAAGFWALTAVFIVTLTGGCAQNELGRYSGFYKVTIKNPKRVRNAIVKSENYWIQREVVPEDQFPGPTPEDLKFSEADYILQPGDEFETNIFELVTPNQPYVFRQRISQSGQVTIPYLGTVKCSGLTTRGLEEKITDMLESAELLTNAQVTIFVTVYANLEVSVINGVGRAGVYPIRLKGMTLLELVAMSGGVLQLVEDYGYVIREYAPSEADILKVEGTTPPVEAEKSPAKTPEKVDETGVKPAAKTPAEGAAKPEEKTPAAKPAEKTPEAGAKPAEKPAAPAAPKNEEKGASPAAKPANNTGEKPPAAKSSAESAKQAREVLEKMAEGEMPEVKKIEAAEAAATGAKTIAEAKSSEAKKPAVAPDARSGIPYPAAEAKKPAAEPAKAKDPAGEAAGKTLAKDEKELGRWVWSDGKWIEVKSDTPAAKPTETKTAEGAKPVEKPKTTETKTAEGTKPVETPKATETVKAPEAAKPAEPVKVAEGTKDETEPGRMALEKKLRRLGVVQGSGQLRRIIRFDVRALQAGDPTQNIVLRDGDIITIPSPAIGDFYMAGEVARPGVYSLTGRKITLLQAVAAAGGTTAVAVPWRTEVVRRITETEEEIIYCDLSKIARGEVPDFYMQAEDIIRVGTDEGAIFNAVIRNAFRATYGLGAVYDMNFADFYPWSNKITPLLNFGRSARGL